MSAQYQFSNQQPFTFRAFSLKSITFANTLYNITTPLTFAVNTGTNPSNFRLSFTIPAGTWVYQNRDLTYAQVSTGTWPANDLQVYILQQFGGALDSININAYTGIWQYNWDNSLTTVQAAAAMSSGTYTLLALYQSLLDGLVWRSLTPVDLSPPIMLGLASNQWDNEQLTSSNGTNNFFALVPVTAATGEVQNYQPI